MPWKKTCVMDERLMFIADCLRGELPMSVVCEQFGISRKTGYKWLARYRAEAEVGLRDRSRAPRTCPWAIEEEMAAAIVALRRRRPAWGPRKLRAVLERDHPQASWPAASTIGDLLRREGLSARQRRRRAVPPPSLPLREAVAANDVWCADFKGWFRTADGERCDPLTISDAHSRYLLDCHIVAPTLEGVRPRFLRAFRAFGLPLAIRTDNGSPFASNGAAGLSRMAVDWLKLGIKVERIAPGQPQQNGRHERMHRTLKSETSRPPAPSRCQQQARFDRFRHDYNHERPHEALAQQPPASHYQPSPRPYPERLPEPWYDAEHAVRRVRTTGEIKWGGDFIFISEVLSGEPVGIAETEDGNWIVRFLDVDLGLIDRKTKRLQRFTAIRPDRCKTD
jgi:putative transposase